MEGNKDFDKDKKAQATQQMPKVDGGDEGEKKGTFTIFGHELDKRKAVFVGLGGLLAIALIGGGTWYAMSRPQDEPPVEHVEKQEEHVIQIGVHAEGWVKGGFSPVIAHIVNKDERVDYCHAYDANSTMALPVPEKGEYEVSFISPVDKDGSTYKVPEKSKVKSEVDNHNKMVNLPFEFNPVEAEKVSADELTAIVKSVGEAVKKGDETLTGANGSKVVELVKENAKANPNADKKKVEEESQKAEDDAGDTGETKPGDGGDGGNGNNNAGGDSGSSGQNQGGNGGSSNSGNSGNGGGQQHVHNWIAETTVVHHDAQYQTIHHEAVYDYRSICNGCGADITGNVDAHMQDALLNGNTACGAYHTENVLVSQAWDETIEISPAWDEEVITGYKCSSCGSTK